MKTKLYVLALSLLLVGCQTFNNSVVTVTEIRKDVIVELATLYKQGRISPETDAKISKADKAFRDAAFALETALVLYKAGNGPEPSKEQLAIVKAAVADLINLAAPYILNASNKHANLNKATQL